MYTRACAVSSGTHGVQKRESGPLTLELQAVVTI